MPEGNLQFDDVSRPRPIRGRCEPEPLVKKHDDQDDLNLLTVVAGPSNLDHALARGRSAKTTAGDSSVHIEDVFDHISPGPRRAAGQVRAARGARLEKVWRPGARGYEGPQERHWGKEKI